MGRSSVSGVTVIRRAVPSGPPRRRVSSTLVPPVPHEQRQRSAHRVDGPPGDGEQFVAVVHAVGGERGAGARVGGLAGQDAVDQPVSVGGAVGVGAEQADRLLGEEGPSPRREGVT